MGNFDENPSTCKIFVTHRQLSQESECYQGIERWWLDLQLRNGCYRIVTGVLLPAKVINRKLA